MLGACLIGSTVHAGQYEWEVIKVIDGDTIVVRADWLIPELGNHISIRVLGVDTPEKGFRGKCLSERQRAEAATEYVRTLIQPGEVIKVVPKRFDKFGGRILGTIDIPGHGDLSQLLVANNFAVPYYGKTKQSWCN